MHSGSSFMYNLLHTEALTFLSCIGGTMQFDRVQHQKQHHELQSHTCNTIPAAHTDQLLSWCMLAVARRWNPCFLLPLLGCWLLTMHPAEDQFEA